MRAYEYQTFRAMLCHAETFGEKALFVRNAERISFTHFVRDILSICTGLREIPERHVLLGTTDEYLYAVLFFACTLTEHVACMYHCNTAVSDSYAELADSVLLTDRNVLPMLNNAQASWETLSDGADHLRVISVSSGTATGKARTIGLSERNLLSAAQAGMEHFLYDTSLLCVHILPYWHMFGLVTELIVPIIAGGTVVLLKTPLSFFSAVQKYSPNCLHLTPAVAEKLAEWLCVNDVGRLKKIMCAGAPMKQTTFKALSERGIKVCMAYGLTECSPCVSLTPEWDIREGSSGKILSCCDVRIADDGEICVSGENVMLGYVDNSGEIIQQPTWFHTGDLGSLEDGYLTIIGRKSSVLVFSDGKKVVPESVEEEINRIASVRECQLSICLNEQGEIPHLKLVTDGSAVDAEKIRTVMERAEMSVYRVSVQQEPLKRNEMGKVIRS